LQTIANPSTVEAGMSYTKSWENYEQVAVYLLDQFADALGLDRVEGKRILDGGRSGTRWRIDGKGIRSSPDEAIVLVECRRYTTSRQSQERVASLAYRILDTGAQGGIIVSPLGIQAGAAKIAESEKIIPVHLDENSTTTQYVLRFLNNVFVGLTDSITVTDHISVRVIPADESDEGA